MNNIELYNEDCMDLLTRSKDNEYHLAIVDVPYGIDAANDNRNGIKFKTAATKRKDYEKKDWDKSIPDENYFKELFRVSKNQIVWGVNYLPYNMLIGGRIFWDKDVPEDYSKSKGELAYKSFGYGVDYIKITWHGMIQHDMKNKENRIHPTQKPVQLYKWLLKNYAKPNDKILDTHLGSGSIAIAIDSMNKIEKMNLSFVGCEIDKDYFEAAYKRIKLETSQLTIF